MLTVLTRRMVNKKGRLCVIAGFRRGDYEIRHLLGFSAA
jgi:hypothetical protein